MELLGDLGHLSHFSWFNYFSAALNSYSSNTVELILLSARTSDQEI